MLPSLASDRFGGKELLLSETILKTDSFSNDHFPKHGADMWTKRSPKVFFFCLADGTGSVIQLPSAVPPPCLRNSVGREWDSASS